MTGVSFGESLGVEDYVLIDYISSECPQRRNLTRPAPRAVELCDVEQ